MLTDINKSRIIKAALGFFMVPYLVFSLTWGDFTLYRASQVFWVLILLIAFFLCSAIVNRTSSFHALVISTILLLSSAVAVIIDISSGYVIDADLLMKTTMLIAIILLIDRFRGIGFDVFIGYSLPIAIIMVIVTSLHFFLNPEIIYGRYTFFGLHPNLGGELLFCCAVIIAYSTSLPFRLFFWIVILILLSLLQSRAAFLGTLLLMVLAELMRIILITEKSTRQQLIGVVILLPSLAFSALLIFYPSIFSRIGMFIYQDILLMDDLYRGAGTGLVGRGETWLAALSVFADNPFFGVGLDRVTSDEDMAVHSGYFALLGEFGIMSLGFFIVLAFGLIESVKQRSIRLAVILACMAVFSFNARSINLNAFPFILWLACLPWEDRSYATVARKNEYMAS